jgi:hypothetical protein
MRLLTTALLIAALSSAARAEEISSVYTDLDFKKDCTPLESSEEGGDFINYVCNGYGGYPIFVYSADLRESWYFGFPKATDYVWESFSAFNSAASKVEWRISRDGDRVTPFATIHRWSISDPEDDQKKSEVLVVAKVGQVKDQDGCAVALVMATGNPKANDTARKIADEQARGFACGGDERVLVGDNIPDFSRSDEARE